MSYTDLHEHGSEAAVKAAGKLKQQGKTYESALLPSPSSLSSFTHLPSSNLYVNRGGMMMELRREVVNS